MQDHDHEAVVARMLGNLSTEQPDAVRSARVMSRCRQILSQKSSARDLRHKRLAKRRNFIELAVVGGFCLVYVSAVALLVLRFEGIL